MRIKFWPSDFFYEPLAALVISEPSAGQARVSWLASRNHYRVRLYARVHATDWPTLDGTQNGTVDPTYLVKSAEQYPPSAYPSSSGEAVALYPQWTNGGYANGNILRVIAVPEGQYGFIGPRSTASRTMQNAVGPALSRSGYPLDNLVSSSESALGTIGTLGQSVYTAGYMSATAPVTNGTYDIEVWCLGRDGMWENAYKTYQETLGGPITVAGYSNIDPARAQKILVRMPFYDNSYNAIFSNRKPLAVAYKLIPQGGGAPVDMDVSHYMWNVGP